MQVGVDAERLELLRLIGAAAGNDREGGFRGPDRGQLFGAELGGHEPEDAHAPRPRAELRAGLLQQRLGLRLAEEREREEKERRDREEREERERQEREERERLREREETERRERERREREEREAREREERERRDKEEAERREREERERRAKEARDKDAERSDDDKLKKTVVSKRVVRHRHSNSHERP